MNPPPSARYAQSVADRSSVAGALPPLLRSWPLLGLYLVAGLLAVVALAFRIFQPIQVLPRIRLAPGFSLLDQNGARLTSEDVRGQFVLYTFAYSRCGTACEAQWQTLRTVQSRLSGLDLEGVPVSIVVVSIDADRDQPEVLKQFATSLGEAAATWRFANTPDAARLKALIGGGFGVYYEEKAPGQFAYDPVFVLVDGWGVVRGEYRYRVQSPDADRIVRHLGVLADEIRNSSGVTKYAYEAAHYFLCYAP